MDRTTEDTVETTAYVAQLPIHRFKTQDNQFVIGRNLITGIIGRTQRILGQNSFEQIYAGVTLSAEIHVIPHFCETTNRDGSEAQQPRHRLTVEA